MLPASLLLVARLDDGAPDVALAPHFLGDVDADLVGLKDNDGLGLLDLPLFCPDARVVM